MSTLNALGPNPYDIITLAPANPAAGANFSLSVNANARWRITFVGFQLVTDANAATRIINVHGFDGTDIFALTKPTDPQGQDVTAFYDFNIGSGEGYTGGLSVHQVAPLNSSLELKLGESIRITITDIQVGDQISDVRVRTQQWIQEE